MVDSLTEITLLTNMEFSLPLLLRRHSVVQALLASKLIRSEQIIRFNGNARAVVDLHDPEPRNVFLKGVFDPDFYSVAQAMLPRNGTFFDLGANVGLCSFGLAPSRTSARYHLFEANDSLISLLAQSARLHTETDFQIIHACVTDQPGETRFYLEENQSGQSHVATAKENGEAVPNLLLDEYVEKNAIERIDFAKMDLEGHELNALKGWRRTLEAGLVEALYLEVMPENQERYELPTNAALTYLKECGYNLYLCKKQNFGQFGEDPKPLTGPGGSISVAHFLAEEYPNDFSSDILAIAPA